MITKEKITEILSTAAELEKLELTNQQLICLVSVVYTFVPDNKLQEAINLNKEFVDYSYNLTLKKIIK